MELRVLHECAEDGMGTEFIFYCSAIPGKEDERMLDWYAFDDNRENDPKSEVNCVSAITYCPFCGIKLADTLGEAEADNRNYRVEIISAGKNTVT